LQAAIDFCTDHGYPLTSRRNKSYQITSKLFFKDRIKFSFGTAKIVAGDVMDYMIHIDKVWDNAYHPFGDWEYFALDGNNKAKVGMYVERGSREHFYKFEINNCTEIGFSHNHMHEAVVKDGHIEKCKIGIKSNGTDCTFDNVNGRDCKTYFLLTEDARAINYINCHAWNNPGYIKDTIFADISSLGACTFRDCYPDTFQIGYKVRGAYTPVTIAGGRFLINDGYWDQEMTENDKSYVLYYDGADYMRYTSVGNMELHGLPNGTTYFTNLSNASYVPCRSMYSMKCFNITNPPMGLLVTMTNNTGGGTIESYVTFLRNSLTCPMDSSVFWTDLIFQITCAAGDTRIGVIPYYYRPYRSVYGYACLLRDGSIGNGSIPTVVPTLPPEKFLGVSMLTNGEIWIHSDEPLTNALVSIQLKYVSRFTNENGY